MDRVDYQYQNDPLDDEGWNSDPFQEIRLDVPLGEVTDLPQRCAQISLDWLPVIIGALERLKYGDMWNGDAADVQRAYQNVCTLQDLLAQGECEGGALGGQCYDLPLHSPIIDYLPGDPFDNPHYVPPGYSLPPWVIADHDEPLNGIQAGDVLIGIVGSLISFPPVVPTSGVPRFQIRVQGPATVDLEFVSVFQGGIAVLLRDGFPQTWVDLQLYSITTLLDNIFFEQIFNWALGVLNPPAQQIEIECPEAREYVIEAQFFPRIGSLTSLGYGGGIRKVQVCSSEEQVDLSGFVQDIRVNGGTVEKKVNNVWAGVDVADDNDVLTESDLRVENCDLQFYDLATGTWQTVPNGTLLNREDMCEIHDTLTMRGDFSPFIRLWHETTGNRIDIYHTGSTGAIAAGPGFQIGQLGNASAIYINSAGQWYFRAASTPIFSKGFFNFSSINTLDLLNIKANNAAVNRLFAAYDSNDRIVFEGSQTGWWSAIQQFILNDFSSVGTKRGQGRLLSQWVDSTDATRKSRLVAQVDDYAAAREAWRAEADGDSVLLGFYGSAAVEKPVVDGADLGAVITDLLDGFVSLGLIDNQSGFTAGNPPEVEAGMETYYELYWDWTDHQPESAEFGIAYGQYVVDEGLGDVIVGSVEGIHINRIIDNYADILAINLQFQIDNLSGGVVTLVVIFEVSDPDLIVYSDSYGEGIHQVQIPIGFSTLYERYDVKLFTDVGEVAVIRLQAFWEQGRGLPIFERALTYNGKAIHTEIPQEFLLPSS